MSTHTWVTATEATTRTTGYPAKRRRTRRRLLQAGMTRLAEQGRSGVSAGGIASAAGVATGTFYNHFPTVDDFYAALAQDVGRGIEIGGAMLTEIENDPAARVAIGTLQLLQMAEDDPEAAKAFVTLVATLPDFRARVRALITSAITDGMAAGRFDVSVGTAATDAVLGAVLQSMRSITLAEATEAEAAGVANLVLRLLGVPDAKIDAIVDRAVSAIADG